MEILAIVGASFVGSFGALVIYNYMNKKDLETPKTPTQEEMNKFLHPNWIPPSIVPPPSIGPWDNPWSGKTGDKLSPVSMTPEAEYEIEQDRISKRSPEEDE